MSSTINVLPVTNPLPPSPPHSLSRPSNRDEAKTKSYHRVNGPNAPIRSPFKSSSQRTSSTSDSVSSLLGPAAEEIRVRAGSDLGKAGLANGHPRRRTKATVQLDDFQLIRVLGKGCAGRVGLSPIIVVLTNNLRFSLSSILQPMLSTQ